MGAVLSDCSVQRTSTRGVQRRRLATAETPANFAGANSKGPVRDAIATHGQGNRWAFKNIPDRSRDRRCFETFGDGKKGACRFPSNGQELIRVAIVDDDEYARFLLKRIVEESGQFQCVGSCASGDEALQAIPIARPKIVLMDIRMPGMSGIESMRQLRRVMPGLIVVLVSGLTDPETMAAALAAGGDGYLTKPFSISQCLATLRFSLRYRGSDARNGADDRVPSSRDGCECARLTKRENEVINGLARGLFYKEIAGELHISYSAVNKHQRRIYQKLHAGNRTEAINNWRDSWRA